jgi:hypothetical protein
VFDFTVGCKLPVDAHCIPIRKERYLRGKQGALSGSPLTCSTSTALRAHTQGFVVSRGLCRACHLRVQPASKESWTDERASARTAGFLP